MWLILDLGNSYLKAGLVEGSTIHNHLRLPSDSAGSSTLREILPTFWEQHTIERIGVVSVVPTLTKQVELICQDLTGITPEIIHHKMRLPFSMGYETPHTLGTDRIAAAAGAWNMHSNLQKPVVAIDAGTAVNYEVIDRDGKYRGGAIAPGPKLIQAALNRGTAQLPSISFDSLPSPLGSSTTKALQAGIQFGFIDSVAGMINRITKALSTAPIIIATGGWASFLAHYLPSIDQVEPHLVLLGVRELMMLNPSIAPDGAKDQFVP